MARPEVPTELSLEGCLRELVRQTLDHEKLVGIARAIASADRKLLDYNSKKVLLGLIRSRVREGADT